MNGICESVRDDLPRYAADALTDARAQQIEAHLERCAACRQEAELIALLRSPLAAPADLEARVRRAVAVAPTRRRARTGLAAAAAIAVIVAGSAVALQWTERDPSVSVSDDVFEAESSELGWAARADPLLHDGPGLGALSDEELEVLLEEMQS